MGKTCTICSISEWLLLRGPLYSLVGVSLGRGGFIVIADPPRTLISSKSRMLDGPWVTFRSEGCLMGSVDDWQFARPLPLSIGRYLPGSYPVATREKVSSWDP
jgi:hypothetical protein